MTLSAGLHHLTFLTGDMDRLIAFYERVFGAQTVLDLEEEGLRHALIEVGPGTFLHPFQVPGKPPPAEEPPMFDRGRLDHFAIAAESEEAFREIRRRLIAEAATDGVVTEIGAFWLLTFHDPDGGGHEVVCTKPGVPVDRGLPRAQWTTVDLD